MAEVENLRAEVDSLKIRMAAADHRIRSLEKWKETVESPLYKRLWFVIQGYRWRRLGVWYRARWNVAAWHYDD